MQRTDEIIRGDTPGTEWRFPVLRFRGRDGHAPSAYLQAALHANELPGVVALDALVPRLVQAEADGRLLGDVTLVPQANPIAAGQYLFAEHMGRFSLGSRVNFNRDFPLLPDLDTSRLPGDEAPLTAERRLKARLVKLALGHDLVLDLHCDDESPSYLYVADPLWPHLSDLAACLKSEAVLLWDGSSDGAFEEAAYAPYRSLERDDPKWSHLAVSTVEFRGRADVSPALAEADAEGLYRFLVGRGVVEDVAVSPPPPWQGPAVPLDHVEMIRAPAAGALLFHAGPGDVVAAGAPLVTILTDPGFAEGRVTLAAPQGGTVLTRRTQRAVRVSDDVMKILGTRPSEEQRAAGALES